MDTINVRNLFFELFEIPKVEYKEPSRMVDNNGDICAWYVNEDYPIIEDVFFDLLNLYEVQYNGQIISTNLSEYDLKSNLMKCLVNLYDALNDELKQQLKIDVQDIFKQAKEI